MFKYDLFCLSNFDEEYSLTINLQNDLGFNNPINFDPCEYGKNLDIKFKPVIDKLEIIENELYSNFLCLNFNNSDSILFNNPSSFL